MNYSPLQLRVVLVAAVLVFVAQPSLAVPDGYQRGARLHAASRWARTVFRLRPQRSERRSTNAGVSETSGVSIQSEPPKRFARLRRWSRRVAKALAIPIVLYSALIPISWGVNKLVDDRPTTVVFAAGSTPREIPIWNFLPFGELRPESSSTPYKSLFSLAENQNIPSDALVPSVAAAPSPAMSGGPDSVATSAGTIRKEGSKTAHAGAATPSAKQTHHADRGYEFDRVVATEPFVRVWTELAQEIGRQVLPARALFTPQSSSSLSASVAPSAMGTFWGVSDTSTNTSAAPRMRRWLRVPDWLRNPDGWISDDIATATISYFHYAPLVLRESLLGNRVIWLHNPTRAEVLEHLARSDLDRVVFLGHGTRQSFAAADLSITGTDVETQGIPRKSCVIKLTCGKDKGGTPLRLALLSAPLPSDDLAHLEPVSSTSVGLTSMPPNPLPPKPDPPEFVRSLAAHVSRRDRSRRGR